MKVLITGGTGFLGKRISHLLHGAGHSIVVASRSGDSAKAKFPYPVETVKWSSAEPFPTGALQGIDTVIHLAGEGIADKRWSEKRKKVLYESRVVGTHHLVNALNQSQVKAFVSTSATGFYGNRGDETLSEGSSLGGGFLAEICGDWEKEAWKAKKEIRTCIVRVGIVLGLEGGALTKLLPLFRAGAGGPVGNGKQWMSWIHAEDVARIFVHCATNSAVRGVFNGVAPQPVTNADFSRALGHALHRPSFVPAPAFALKIAMGEMAVLVLDSQRVLPPATEGSGFHFHFPELGRALSDLLKKKAN